MKEYVFVALTNECDCFKEDLEKQQQGTLEKEYQFNWNALLVNSNYPELAREFLKLNPKNTDKDLESLENFIEKAEEKDAKATRCIKFGCCAEEEVCESHSKILKNSSGEISNSPAYILRESNLLRYKKKAEFEEVKENVFELITSGDKSAYINEDFIDGMAELKLNNIEEYNSLVEELKGFEVKLTAFYEAISEACKNKNKNTKKETVTNIDLPDNLKPYADNLGDNNIFINENGHIYTTVTTANDSYQIQLSNFVARIKEVLEFDDGVTVIQQFVIDGILDGNINLPEIVINAKDFRSMSWVLSEWGNVIITSQSKATDLVRETIQQVSVNAPITKVHYMVGWKKIDGQWYYLYSGGVVGENNKISVAEISEIKGYYFNPKVVNSEQYSLKKSASFVEKFLNVAPHEITIPLLAHTFLSVLIEKLKEEEIEPRYLLWVFGVSGSFKTALVVVLMNFFGVFNSPPSTFNDTIVALEKKTYLAKDSLIIVDDFHPASSLQESKNKMAIANNLTRRFGDRITKSRSRSNLKLAPDYPPRGNALCTSEDLIVGHSTNSRHMAISINRGDISPELLTELQNNKLELNCFMYSFIEYVAENVMNKEGIKYKDKFLKYRNLSQDHNHHKRFAEAIACLQIGWEALLDFMIHISYIDDEKYKNMFDEGFEIFKRLAKKQNELIQNDDIADKFMGAIKELIDTKQIVPASKDSPSHIVQGTVICYDDEDNYYFIPKSTYAKVSEFFIKSGDLLNVGEYMLRKMLVDKKYVVESSDGDGHRTTKIKVGVTSIRVLQIPKRVLNTF